MYIWFFLSQLTYVNYYQIESSQEDGVLQPFNHGRGMSLIPRNQLGLASQSAFHVENFVPYVWIYFMTSFFFFFLRSILDLTLKICRSRTSGIVHHGLIFPINQQTQNFGSINTYQLPTSSLPPKFRLESSSGMQLPQIQQPQSQVSVSIVLFN